MYVGNWLFRSDKVVYWTWTRGIQYQWRDSSPKQNPPTPPPPPPQQFPLRLLQWPSPRRLIIKCIALIFIVTFFRCKYSYKSYIIAVWRFSCGVQVVVVVATLASLLSPIIVMNSHAPALPERLYTSSSVACFVYMYVSVFFYLIHWLWDVLYVCVT